jgi:transcription elongation factor GreA
MAEERNLSLDEAVTMYLATLPPEQRQESQQELNRFVRWYGAERLMSELGAREIGEYGESVSKSIRSSVTDPAKKIEPVRNFLTYAKKTKLTGVNLAPNLRVSKTKKGPLVKRSNNEPAQVHLTSEGHAAMKSELESLKDERPRVVEQIRHAAADKDFRENAPLEAAREHQGQLEARIRELEATIKGATIMKEKTSITLRVGIGCTVGLFDLTSGEQLHYTLVSPSESNPTKGKLSIASPTGKALLDREVGAVVEVTAPVGMFLYRIEDIKG